MKSNFEFLNRYWPALAQIGAAAESYVYSDPNACLYKLGMFGERLILEIFAFEHIKEPTIDNTHANRIRLLKRECLIPKKIDDMLQLLPLLRMLLHPLVCGSGSFRVHRVYPAPIRLKLFVRLSILEGHELTALSAFTKSL